MITSTRLCSMLAILALLPFIAASATLITFLGRPYHLGSFNQKDHAMWEFSSANETVNNWTTLVTVIDRTDARSRSELDRLAQGVMDNYKSHGGRILMARTMTDSNGTPYNYIVAAFEQPADHRFELNFVKAALGPQNAYMVIYGVRITDPHDYTSKAKAYLDTHSSEVGKELEGLKLPALSTLPRKEF
jgi:hypothetical protein